MKHGKIWEVLRENEKSECLVEWILSRYSVEMAEIGYTSMFENEENARIVLQSACESQQEQFRALEAARRNQMKSAMILGIQYGLFVGFKQYFVKDYTGHPFEELFGRTVQPNSEGQYTKYHITLREAANKAVEELGGNLDPFSREHLISIEVANEEREFGILRYAFLLGYHAAHEIICDIELQDAFLRIAEKVWQTEYEFGFESCIRERYYHH